VSRKADVPWVIRKKQDRAAIAIGGEIFAPGRWIRAGVHGREGEVIRCARLCRVRGAMSWPAAPGRRRWTR